MRILLAVAGWACVLLGIIGLFLPILQGILFLVLGLLILSVEYRWARRLLDWLGDRYPAVRRLIESERFRKWRQTISVHGKHDMPK